MSMLTDGDSVTLTLRSDPRLLGLVRAVIRSFASLAGFDDAGTYRITLAVDEACTNVMRHAYGGRSDGEFAITCSIVASSGGATRLVVRLVDRGAACKPGALAKPAPRERPDPTSVVPGGLGIHLMYECMDSIRVLASEDGSNMLELEIACPAPTST